MKQHSYYLRSNARRVRLQEAQDKFKVIKTNDKSTAKRIIENDSYDSIEFLKFFFIACFITNVMRILYLTFDLLNENLVRPVDAILNQINNELNQCIYILIGRIRVNDGNNKSSINI